MTRQRITLLCLACLQKACLQRNTDTNYLQPSDTCAHSHLFIFYPQCGEARLQLVVAHQQLCLDRLLCTHLTHLGLRKKGSLPRGFNTENIKQDERHFMSKTKTFKTNHYCIFFPSDSPRPPCVAGSQSVLEDRKSGCVCPYTSACLLCCPWHLPILPASPDLRGVKSPDYTPRTGRFSRCVPGLHGNLGRSTENKK